MTSRDLDRSWLRPETFDT